MENSPQNIRGYTDILYSMLLRQQYQTREKNKCIDCNWWTGLVSCFSTTAPEESGIAAFKWLSSVKTVVGNTVKLLYLK